jgi:hypothetical protein
MKLIIGVFIIVLGIMLLSGISIGGILAGVFLNFFKIWPLIIIMIGLGILSEVRGFKWVKYINWVVSAFFVLFLIFAPADISFRKMNNEEFILKTNEIYSHYNFEANLPVANITFETHSDSPDIKVYTRTRREFGGVEMFANKIIINYEPFSTPIFFYGEQYIISFPEQKTFSVVINCAVSNTKFNLNNNVIRNIELNSAIVNFRLDINNFISPVKIVTNAAISNLEIKLPEGTTYYFNNTAPLRSLSGDSKLIQSSSNSQVSITNSSAIISSNIKSKK